MVTQISSLHIWRAVSVVVITSALHAEGRQFEPGTAQFWTDQKFKTPLYIDRLLSVDASVAQ